MKNTIYILVLALTMGACTYKNEAITLKPYEAYSNTTITKEKKNIYIQSIQDVRIDKKSIGYALENGEKKIIFFTHENFKKKYEDVLLYAFNILGFNTEINKSDASLVIDIYIKDIELIQMEKFFDKNIKGKIVVELVVRKGSTVTRYTFTQNEAKWMSPSHNSKDLEPFLSTLFAGSINSITAKLAE